MGVSLLSLQNLATKSGPMSAETSTWQRRSRAWQPELRANMALLDAPKRRPLRRCSWADVLAAFKIVNQEIRLKCRRLVTRRPTQVQVCELARRIKDQRDLVQQIDGTRAFRHVWRLLRQNRRLRSRLVRIADQWGLDSSILVFK
jgi:hypothetical protein